MCGIYLPACPFCDDDDDDDDGMTLERKRKRTSRLLVVWSFHLSSLVWRRRDGTGRDGMGNGQPNQPSAAAAWLSTDLHG